MESAKGRRQQWLDKMAKTELRNLPRQLDPWVDIEDIEQELNIARLEGIRSPGTAVRREMNRLARNQGSIPIVEPESLRPTENNALWSTFDTEVERAVKASALRRTSSVGRLTDIFISRGAHEETLAEISTRHSVSKALVDQLFRITRSRIRRNYAHLLRPFLER